MARLSRNNDDRSEIWLDCNMTDDMIREIGGNVMYFRRVFGAALPDAKTQHSVGGYFDGLEFVGGKLLLSSLEKLMSKRDFAKKFKELYRMSDRSLDFVTRFVPKAREYYS